MALLRSRFAGDQAFSETSGDFVNQPQVQASQTGPGPQQNLRPLAELLTKVAARRAAPAQPVSYTAPSRSLLAAQQNQARLASNRAESGRARAYNLDLMERMRQQGAARQAEPTPANFGRYQMNNRGDWGTFVDSARIPASLQGIIMGGFHGDIGNIFSTNPSIMGPQQFKVGKYTHTSTSPISPGREREPTPNEYFEAKRAADAQQEALRTRFF